MTKSNSSVAEAVQKVKSSVESMDAAKTERIGSPSLGDVVRQGDLYLVCIDKMPTGDKIKATQERQLAQGSTQGARHVLSGNAQIVTGVTSFQGMNTVLIGPAFHCKGDVEVTHPEHGNKILPEGTTWQCTFQQAYADEVRRVAD